jgi:SAM-dependent methyltransferase
MGGAGADLLADAHALPFLGDSFDGVLCYAVLEHLHNPHVALREAHRVLKSGGVLCGAVSQGEPFHSSFFHMTPWAVLTLFEAAGFRVHRLWPGPETLFALAGMGRYPRVIKHLLRLVARADRAFPFLAPRRWRWPLREKQLDELYRAGSICFLAEKVAEEDQGD